MSLNIEKLVSEIHDYLERAFKPVSEDMRDLRRRVEELEKAQPNLADSYKGTHDKWTTYKRGNLVTDAGALWLCVAPETEDKPGKGAGWRLIAKSGGEL